MKSIFYFLLFSFLLSSASAQKWSGQWSGSFDARGEEGYRTEYVLEIEAKGNKFTGSSVTYFTIGGKRYYTICEITGTIDPASKTLTSTETKVIKRNTPPDFRDCLQTHILTYFKKGDTEELSGVWKSAKVDGGCGTGSTVLSRKKLVTNTVTTPVQNNNTVRNNTNSKPVPPVTKKPETTKPPVTNNPNVTSKPPVTKPGIKKDSIAKEKPVITKVDNQVNTNTKPDTKPVFTAPKLSNGLERRDNKVFETITIEEEEITVTLFDNAEIDGDIITVLFNGEVVAFQKQLSDKPITLKLKALKGRENTLTMYAENQGRIPPNTAIMRVQCGDNYYKVFLSADDKKNASVVFRVK
jgi:hypothetical protein